MLLRLTKETRSADRESLLGVVRELGHEPRFLDTGRSLVALAQAVRAAGATLLRGGAYEPRSSPRSFHGLGQAHALAASGKEAPR